MTTVGNWVSAQGYNPTFVADFLNQADYFLISSALAHSHTIVTHEKLQIGTKKIKIPNVCMGLGVTYINNFTMLRDHMVRFVLQ